MDKMNQVATDNLPALDGASSKTQGTVRPQDGALPLPMLTLDMAAYRANRDSILAYAGRHGALLSPHVKTAMIPELATDFVAAGGWGVTVADVRQAEVMIAAGVKRLMLANEVGIHGARHFARLVAAHPDVELSVFADSTEGVAALVAALEQAPRSAPVPLLLEVGAGRAGARDAAAFAQVLEAAVAAESAGTVIVAGVAAYEGAAAIGTPDEAVRRVDALMELQVEALRQTRKAVGPERRLVATAGGSMYFDRVVAVLGAGVVADGNADLIIRPGAILFGDHGLYERAFGNIDARHGFTPGASARAAFHPVLRVWAEVLSRPEQGLVVCGMGMRNVSYDAGLPRALRVFRGGADVQADVDGIAVTKLNDQHAFVTIGNADLRVGDIVEFGISHPCTCMHLWRTVLALDADGVVSGSFTTHFG